MSPVVRCRIVVNDAFCHEWEVMPEVQPPTFAGLINYLRKDCNIDPEPLSIEGHPAARENPGTLLNYGLRRQFWVPDKLTDDDLELLEHWAEIPDNVPCPICGNHLNFHESYTEGFTPERYCSASCQKCDLRFTKASQMPRTARQLARILQKSTP